MRAALRYDGPDVAVLLGLVAGGHGLALLPAAALAGRPELRGVPVGTPRLVHRREMVRAPAAATGTGPAALLGRLLLGG
ncbi:hypothetical protein [Actinoplanes sp. NPDC023714]|uniref:hypothetical protein n=1 Tax=Actinoplanes sp. NPDC023714 TaxID=3154322 RepID=UPI00340D9867